MYRYIRSVAKHYPIRLPDGSYTKFADGGTITKARPIAGVGTNTELRVAIGLEQKYHVDRKFWSKWRGEGHVIQDGKAHRVELHWYEARDKRYEIKVKKDFDVR